MAGGDSSLLLALPDSCLLRVLQCCAAEGHRILFNAARAHSRLHQTAVLALRSIRAQVPQQQQMDSVMVYLGKHGQHVDSLELRGDERFPVHLPQLPPQLQLTSLQLQELSLQLQPGNGSHGVLGAAASVAALKQLRLTDCKLRDDRADDALAAALALLPDGLEHLSLSILEDAELDVVKFPADVLHQLQHLQHLTCLELSELNVQDVGGTNSSPDLHCSGPLQTLTGLVGLKLEHLQVVISSSRLSGMQRLTGLELKTAELEPGALAGMTQLQHLALVWCTLLGGAAGVAQLLSHLQPLQQLTHLNVYNSLQAVEGSNPPASAYAALTASSKLQHLDISNCKLPGLWQHLFPTGRQLPNLQSLSIMGTKHPSGIVAQAPEGSRLVSCCPGLRSLRMEGLRSPELALVQGLSGLQTLWCSRGDATAEFVPVVCQLTGLRELAVWGSWHREKAGSLLQLTQLQQLTKLYCSIGNGRRARQINLSGGDEPVWQQLARFHLGDADPAVAQQAAAALAGLQ